MTSAITREHHRASEQEYDVVIVGGGIYGAMTMLEASQAGLRTLLLEQRDFGSGTSFNNLRILHGGLRYLQTLDIYRFRESIKERRWYMRTFPELVEPLSCVMPLYGSGMKRRDVFLLALWINAALSLDRNWGVQRDKALGVGRVVDRQGARQLLPMIESEGLQGAALWYDACMPDCHRILIEVIRWACELGSVALNYTRVEDLVIEAGCVTGVAAVDTEHDQAFKFRTKTVINATGPHSRAFSARYGADYPELFVPSIAWNLLFDVPPVCEHALALTPRRANAQTYFVYSWRGKLMVGTGHSAATNVSGTPRPTEAQLNSFIDDINACLPTVGLSADKILRVLAGYLPVSKPGGVELTSRDVIVDHAKKGGIRGLYSVSGAKFTTARRTAEKVVATVLQTCQSKSAANNNTQELRNARRRSSVKSPDDWPLTDIVELSNQLSRIIEEESALHLDDLLYRRINFMHNPDIALGLGKKAATLFDWDSARQLQELRSLEIADICSSAAR